MRKITSKFENCNILVADDYIINQELVKEMLEMMGCAVDVAEDGEEALELYQSGQYDLIFMDIQMPELDGYEVTARIRKIEGESSHIAIVAVTANALSGDKEKCIEAGMDDYISKPIKGDSLEGMLKKYLPEKLVS